MQNIFILYTKHTFSEYEKIPLQIRKILLTNTKRTPYKHAKSPLQIRKNLSINTKQTPYKQERNYPQTQEFSINTETNSLQTRKSPEDISVLRAFVCKRRRLPTLPHCIAVPSAQVGLTSLFGMGRGGTPPQ